MQTACAWAVRHQRHSCVTLTFGRAFLFTAPHTTCIKPNPQAAPPTGPGTLAWPLRGGTDRSTVRLLSRNAHRSICSSTFATHTARPDISLDALEHEVPRSKPGCLQ